MPFLESPSEKYTHRRHILLSLFPPLIPSPVQDGETITVNYYTTVSNVLLLARGDICRLAGLVSRSSGLQGTLKVSSKSHLRVCSTSFLS